MDNPCKGLATLVLLAMLKICLQRGKTVASLQQLSIAPVAAPRLRNQERGTALLLKHTSAEHPHLVAHSLHLFSWYSTKMSDPFAGLTPEQVHGEAIRLARENARVVGENACLTSLMNAQRLVTALIDALLALPYEQPKSCSGQAKVFH